MAFFAVEYTYDPSRAEEQDAVRPLHRAFLSGLAERGVNIASGPLTTGAPGALILVRADSAEEVASLLEGDPFHTGGFLAERVIRGWNPVIGILAE